jgi:hypothetical protein
MSIDLPGTPNSLRSNAVDQAERQRPVLARHIDRLLLEAERPLVSRGPRTLVRPAVATAARPSLVAIAAMLRDERRHVAPDAVEAVRAFLQDGADSPLYGRDPATAALAAATVEMQVSGPPAGARRELRLPVAV